MTDSHDFGLEHLFGSRTRLKLLTLFLQNPEQAFFVRELVRRIGSQIHSVRRELMNLCQIGIVQTSGGVLEKGVSSELRKKFFKANPDFLLYDELQTLIRKAHVLVERNMVERITNLGDVKYLALCGRFLGEKAPIDMLVVGKLPAPSLARLLKKKESDIGFEVNYTLMTPEEFSYRRDITARFLYSVLESKKAVMVNTFPGNP
ncbi:MAG: hypothetical protein Q8P82_03320 [bacterium]|nr:hypothetical protein [bacterium]